MIALEVEHNGKRVCTAGIGSEGVIGAHVTWVRRKGSRTQHGQPDSEEVEFSLEVGGLDSAQEEHCTWQTPGVAVGDLVSVRILDTEEITPWSEARRNDPAQELEQQKAYVRKMASRLGWIIDEQRDS